MKQIVFITTARFWFQGAGFWARSREMVKFLSQQGQLTVICLGAGLQRDIDAARQFGGRIQFCWLGKPSKGQSQQEYWKAQFQKISDTLPKADMYFIDKTVWLSKTDFRSATFFCSLFLTLYICLRLMNGNNENYFFCPNL